MKSYIINFWLAFYLAFNTCHLCIFSKTLCMWQSFLTCVLLCCMDLRLFGLGGCSKDKYVRVYSYNFAIWLSHWICCQLSFYCQDNKKKRKIMLMWVTFWGLCSQEIFDNICRLFDCHTGWAFWGRGGRHCYWHLVPLQ